MCDVTENEQGIYLEFRKEIDTLSFPHLKKWSGSGYVEIKKDDLIVGFLMVIENYVEGIYVKPEYRRLGLAGKAVLDYIKGGGVIERLHIVKSNKTALLFWKSIFCLRKIDECPCDTLYSVTGVKKGL